MGGLFTRLRRLARRIRDRLLRAEHRALADQAVALEALRCDMAALTKGMQAAAALHAAWLAAGQAAHADALAATRGQAADGLSALAAQLAVQLAEQAAASAERVDLHEALVAAALEGVSVTAPAGSPGAPAAADAAPPVVSVIMPVRDRAGMVGGAIRSVQDQDFAAWELIVVDDGSTDGTASVVAGFAADPRIRLERIAHAGQSHARNIGIGLARGAVIAYLDSDNLALPGYLAGLAAAFSADPEMQCAYAALVTDAPYVGGRRVLWQAYDRAALTQANFIDVNVFSHRAALAGEVGGFDPSLSRLTDWDFVLRCTARHAPRRLALAGAFYRTRGEDRVSARDALGSDMFRIRRKLLPAPGRKLAVLYVVGREVACRATHVATEIRAMLRRGVAVAVWCEDDAALPFDTAAPRHRGTLDDAIARVRPDIVHIHGLASAVRHASAVAGIAVTVCGHGLDATADARHLLLAQPGVAAVHMFAHEIAALGVQDARLRPRLVAFDSALFVPGRAKDRRLVVRLATALPAKDFALFFELARRMPDFRFVLAACTAPGMEQYPAELRAMAAAMGSPAELQFDLSHGEAAALVGRAGLYLHTVVADAPIGMPISIAEAMATGAVPVVCDLPALVAYVGTAGFAYHDIDGAEAVIRATAAWDDAAWGEAWRRAVDQAFGHFGDDLVLQPLLEDWLAIA